MPEQLELTLLFPVPGYKENFAVDRHGGVWGIREHPSWPRRRERKLKTYERNSRGNGGNYRAVRLSMARGLYQRHVSVHSLVAAVFLGARPPGYLIDHKNRDKSDNCPGNLEYVTRSESERRKRRGNGGLS